MTGELLGGRYSMLDTIGEGGMATVYRARDGFLERTVAIKVLRPQYASDGHRYTSNPSNPLAPGPSDP